MASLDVVAFKEEAVGAMDMVRQWSKGLEGLLQGLHRHLLKDLALFSVAMTLARHSHSGRIAANVPSAAKLPSRQRRWERLLHNPRLLPQKVMGRICSGIVQRLGQRVVLILDETPNGNTLSCLKLSIGYHKRAIPVGFICYKHDHPPEPMPQLLWKLLRRVGRCLPAGCQVTLLADRGLSWPILLDCCQALGWHYVRRMQSDGKVKLADGSERSLWELARRSGSRWMGEAEIFKKAGWRKGNLVATWEKGCKDRWLLITDLPASFQRCRNYCKRSWCEQMHRDEKSSGFCWHASQVRKPDHAQRLVLVMALAMLLCLSLGTYLIKRGMRKQMEPTRRRLLSIFQLGVRWLQNALVQGHSIPAGLYLVPP